MAQSDGEDLIAKLERLGKLHADGALSDEEFAHLKAKLVADGQAGARSDNDDRTTRAADDASVSTNQPPAAAYQSPNVAAPITLGFIVGWMWAGLATLSAIGLFAEGAPAAAILILVSAIVALPPANAFASANGLSVSGGVRFIIALAATIGAGLMIPHSLATNSAGQNSSSTASSGPDANSGGSTVPTMPADEASFVAAVQSARDAYEAAPNDMAKGGTRATRKAGICQALANGASVAGWIGTIETLSSNGDGKGVLKILLAPNVSVGTWNNALSDFEDNTLMAPNSPVFAAASAMKEGDAVRFSGNFATSNVDCTEEQSVTLQGSMDDPEFVFVFTSIGSPSTAPTTAAAQPDQSPAPAAAAPVQSSPAPAPTQTPDTEAQGVPENNSAAPGNDAPAPDQQSDAAAAPALGFDAMVSRFGNTIISRGAGAEWHTHFKSDGTFSGKELHSNYEVTGTWKIASGDLCVTFQTAIPGTPQSTCQPLVERKIGDTWTSKGNTVTLVQGLQ